MSGEREGAIREHVDGRRHPPKKQKLAARARTGARFVIVGTDVKYLLAGARQDTTALRAIPLG